MSVPVRRRAAPTTAELDRRSRPWWKRAHDHGSGIRVAPRGRTCWTTDSVNEQPVLPQYSGANVRGIVPALLAPRGAPLPAWMPPLAAAPQTVLFVLDGLGWEQLRERAAL